MYFLFFMVVSLVEGLAVYTLIMNIFRLKPLGNVREFILVISLINLSNYFLRDEVIVAGMAPVINIVLLTIFIAILVRVPLVWSALISLIGFVMYAVFQIAVSLGLQAVGLIEIEQMQQGSYSTAFIPFSTAIFTIVISTWLYKKGYGFVFPFTRFRWRFEEIALSVSLLIVAAVVAILFFIHQWFAAGGCMLAALIILLLYSFKKEVEHT